MKFTAIIVLTSLLASFVSFVNALARPKLGASRIQMTTKMSNGMAANIKTMVGVVVTGLAAVSTPAWGVGPISHKFVSVITPNDVKLEIPDPKAMLTFYCNPKNKSISKAVLDTNSFDTDERVEEDNDDEITCKTDGVVVSFKNPDKIDDVETQLLPQTQKGTFTIMYKKGGFWTINQIL